MRTGPLPAVTLTAEGRARFDELVARDLKPFTLVVKDDLFQLGAVSQDATPTPILRVEMLTRPLKKRFFIAAEPAWTLLTGHVDRFNALPHAPVTSLERARAVARIADMSTTTWQLGQLAIASFDEIPWRPWLEDRDRKRIEAARATAGARIAPERESFHDDTYTFETWVVTEGTLLLRTLAVTTSGTFSRSDEIVADPVPVPLGRHWGLVDGRLIPTG
jgi:hypothetical protein